MTSQFDPLQLIGPDDILPDGIANPHSGNESYLDAEAARVRTGVCPVDAEWDHARDAHGAAERALAASPEAAVPQPVRDAVDALGGLLAVWDGYGEDG